jgi:hypothetical protein
MIPQGSAKCRCSISCLIASLAAAAPVTGEVRLHAHVNGPYDAFILARLSKVLRAQHFPTELTTDAVQDKVSAVNFGLIASRQARADAFLTVDNDLYFRAHVLRRMLEIYQVCAGRRPIGCEKLPFVPVRATEFQRTFSVFGEFVVRSRILDNRRISGSLYIINPHSIGSFPAGCNEGDYLTQIGAVHSNQYIYSEYPPTFRDEVLRRRRLAAGAAATGFRRDFQDASVVDGWATSRRVMESISRYQLWRPFLLFSQVMLYDSDVSQLISSDSRIHSEGRRGDRNRIVDLVNFIDPVELGASYPRWWFTRPINRQVGRGVTRASTGPTRLHDPDREYPR